MTVEDCWYCGAAPDQPCDLNCHPYRDAFLGPENLRPID
jgi:hypothetical protein